VAGVKFFGFYSPKEGNCWFWNVVVCYIVTMEEVQMSVQYFSSKT